MQTKRINVIGMGYIGLPTAVILIKAGYQVVGTDKNKARVESVKSCNVSTNEPGLHNAVKGYVENGFVDLLNRARGCGRLYYSCSHAHR